MNEIEKLYENVGIERTAHCVLCDNPCPDDCYTGYLFTTNKQILLIQWLLDKTDLYLHRNKSDFTYSIATGDIAVNKYKCFNESIAELINAIWQDLTEEEKQQIKNILEG